MRTRTYVFLFLIVFGVAACETAVPVGPSPVGSDANVDIQIIIIDDHDDHSGDKGNGGDPNNRPPVLIVPNAQENTAGDNVALPVTCIDPDDGDTLTFSASGLPRGLQQDSGTGLIAGNITDSSPESSPFFPNLVCSDGRLNDSGVFQWTVNAPDV